MAAMTGDQIVDRVRSICAGASFGLVEAETWEDFDAQPATNCDGVFRVPPTTGQQVIGQFAYAEDRTDLLEVWVARRHNSDPAGIRRTLIRDVHSLTAAIVRDAHQASGDYAVLDEGRGHEIAPDEDGAEFVTLRLLLPVNYECQL